MGSIINFHGKDHDLDLEANVHSNSHFKFSVQQLSEIHDPKSLRKLQQLGGIKALNSDLNTDPVNGLSISLPDIVPREHRYGRNQLPQKMSKSFLRLCLIILKDKTLIILSIAAVVSLALGLYETFGQPTSYDEEGKVEPKVQWVEGVAIMVAIAIVVFVGAANDYNKEKQFVKLNAKKDDRQIIVYRSGEKHFISINDLLVGDIIYVETGDIVPADSVLVSGSCECDESSLTGETNTIKKVAADVALRSLPSDGLDRDLDIGYSKSILDPMLISGSKMLGGQGKALVTAVGPNSMHGKIMVSLNHEPDPTPLQVRLDKLADDISKFAVYVGSILFFILFFKFCDNIHDNDFKKLTSSQIGSKFLQILITSIALVVVAIPEGLPLAVTLSLAFATTRMTKDGNLVRVLKSCETMGGATAICSDKTGTLTENKMKVVRGSLGDESFDDTADSSLQSSIDVIGKLDSTLKNSIVTNIVLNSTAFENRASEEAEARTIISQKQKRSIWKKLFGSKHKFTTFKVEEDPFVGSKTECALLLLAKENFNAIKEPLERTRKSNEPSIAQLIPFESSRKWGGFVIKTETGFRFYVKGASELISSKCKYKTSSNGDAVPITNEIKEQVMNEIVDLANDALRTLSLAHCDFQSSSWPPENLKSLNNPKIADVTEMLNQCDLVLDCLVGIQDPLRAGVKDAIVQCQKAGVRVRMVTGDNILTARAISKNCGILTEDKLADPNSSMEGPAFRTLTPEKRIEVVPNLCVLARSSPEDKRILVQTLKELGEVVAVTGDGTNDAPALKLADVGFSMGVSGTEVAREASDIILMTDDFGSIVNAIKWGRTVSTSVRKFVQFQLTVNITAVVLTAVSAISSEQNESVLTAVQLLWVNLIMDTLAALALATDKPDDNVLNRKPMGRTAPLISTSMWKMILGQSGMQVVVTFIIHYCGENIFFNNHANDHEKQQINALTFNAFVWLQFFKLFVTRKLDEGDGLTTVKSRISRSNLDFSENLFRNWYFIVISIGIGAIQVLIMFIGGASFSISRQTGAMWGVAILCGLIALPHGMVIRIIPDIWVEKAFPTRAFNKLMSILSFYWVPFLFKNRKTSDQQNSSQDGSTTNSVSNSRFNDVISLKKKNAPYCKTTEIQRS